MKCIRKVLASILLFIFAFLSFNFKISAKSVNVYTFYGETCPHCEEALKYLESIRKKYDLKIYKYEVWNNLENRKIMSDIASFMDVNVRGVPFVIIDNTAIFGYSSSTNETYRFHIKQASKNNFVDEVGIKLGVVDDKIKQDKVNKTNKITNYLIKLPFIGKANLKNISLSFTSCLFGIIDGFNPSMVCLLLFLTSILIGIKDKKRVWFLGLIFIVISLLAYMVFMLRFSHFKEMVNVVIIVRTLIAIIAVIEGIKSLNNYANSLIDIKNNVFKNKKRSSSTLAIISVTLLGVFASIINSSSSDFFTIFNEFLKMNDLSTFKYWVYIIMYIIFFMITILIIFALLVKIMQLIITRTKYFDIIRGIIMIIVGILLISKPEWLMFNIYNFFHIIIR